MKYDDATWHTGDGFPVELSEDAGATHIGMFFAWALSSGLGSKFHCDEFAGELLKLKKRAVTPGRYLIDNCDGKLTAEDMSAEGNAFAADYFDSEDRGYVDDYDAALVEELPSVFHVSDTWDNYDRLKPVLDERLSEWRRNSRA